MESLMQDALKASSALRNLAFPQAKVPPTHPSEDSEIRNILMDRLPRIKIIGVGGMGNNTVSSLMQLGGAEGVEIIAINTDAHHLLSSQANRKLLIGKKSTRGFGCGNTPGKGEIAARESLRVIHEAIQCDLCFVVCGLGGGTGTGAAPVIAAAAKEAGALTISVCTLPFKMEGTVRRNNAHEGLCRLYEASDTLIIVPNERLIEISHDMSMLNAFKTADKITVRGVKAISELITTPQMINLDLADVRKVLGEGGVALIGLGESNSAKDKVTEAVDEALRNPLQQDVDIGSARRALICVMGGTNLSLQDAESAVLRISNEIEQEAEIIWGASVEPTLGSTVRVIAILSDVKSMFTEDPALSRTGPFSLMNEFFSDLSKSALSEPSQVDLPKQSVPLNQQGHNSMDEKPKKKRFGFLRG
ncbi:MAG: cell division protein FtsZ [Candidatus Hodarchaeota archaeon]